MHLALMKAWHGHCVVLHNGIAFIPYNPDYDEETIMITLTDSAVKAVNRFINGAEQPAAGLRILVAGGGCSGLQYSLKLENEVGPTDTVVEYDDVKVFVDPESIPLLVDPMSYSMLQGLSIDFVDSLTQTGFKFSNPNATKSCACGSSFAT